LFTASDIVTDVTMGWLLRLVTGSPHWYGHPRAKKVILNLRGPNLRKWRGRYASEYCIYMANLEVASH